MRFTTYRKYEGGLLDAVNLQNLLDNLADFLLQSGFAGGPNYHPWWGWTGDEGGDKSLDALKEALLRALIEGGHLTPEMLKELRGEGKGNPEVRRQLAEMLDELVKKLVDEGYINLENNTPQMPDGHQLMN